MGHEVQDRASLEMAKLIAAELSLRPDEVLAIARENLDRWSRLHATSPALLRCDKEWLELLNRPVAEICEILTAETDEGQRLRQNSPFPGVLPYRLVWEIKRRARHDKNAA